MNRDELLALAERCEAAEGRNYALEVEIFKAVHPEYAGYVEGRGGLVHPYDGSDQRVLSDVRPGNYTASLDAAMTLVPEGWAIERLTAWPASPEGASNQTPAQSTVHLCGTSTERMGRKMVWGHSGRDGRVEATGNTPALALTAACLRALASKEQS